MHSSTERDLFHKGALVLQDPWVCTLTAGMQNGDEGLSSIILAGQCLLVKILITRQTHSRF